MRNQVGNLRSPTVQFTGSSSPRYFHVCCATAPREYRLVFSFFFFLFNGQGAEDEKAKIGGTRGAKSIPRERAQVSSPAALSRNRISLSLSLSLYAFATLDEIERSFLFFFLSLAEVSGLHVSRVVCIAMYVRANDAGNPSPGMDSTWQGGRGEVGVEGSGIFAVRRNSMDSVICENRFATRHALRAPESPESVDIRPPAKTR